MFSDDDNDKYKRKSVGVAPVTTALYNEECGSCHMPYLPGLLPERSWKKIMSELENHFDDNAELDKITSNKISKFLIMNSADKSNYRRSRKIMRSLSSRQTPIRITKTPYIIRKHDEIPDRLIKANKKVNSLSNCNACHKKAQQGMFDEDGVAIPGYGRWDD